MSVWDELVPEQVSGGLTPRKSVWDDLSAPGPKTDPLSAAEDQRLRDLEEQNRRRKEAQRRLDILAADQGTTAEELREKLRDEGRPAEKSVAEAAFERIHYLSNAVPPALAGLVGSAGGPIPAIAASLGTGGILKEGMERVQDTGQGYGSFDLLGGMGRFGLDVAGQLDKAQPWLKAGPLGVPAGLAAAAYAASQNKPQQDLTSLITGETKPTMYDESSQLQAEHRRERPIESFFEELAPIALGQRPGFGQVGERAKNVVMGGALGLGSELAGQWQTGDWSLPRAALALAAGSGMNVPWGPYKGYISGTMPKTRAEVRARSQQAAEMDEALARLAAGSDLGEAALDQQIAAMRTSPMADVADARAVPPVIAPDTPGLGIPRVDLRPSWMGGGDAAPTQGFDLSAQTADLSPMDLAYWQQAAGGPAPAAQPPSPMPEAAPVFPWEPGGPTQAAPVPGRPAPERGVNLRGAKADIESLYAGRTPEKPLPDAMARVDENLSRAAAGDDAVPQPREGVAIGEVKLKSGKKEAFFEKEHVPTVDPVTSEPYVQQIVEDGTEFVVRHYADRIEVGDISAKRYRELTRQARAAEKAGDAAGAAKLRAEADATTGKGLGEGGYEMMRRMAEARGVPLMSDTFDSISKHAAKRWESWSEKGMATFDEATGRYRYISENDRGRLPVVRRFAGREDMEGWYAKGDYSQPWGDEALKRSQEPVRPGGTAEAPTGPLVPVRGGDGGPAAPAQEPGMVGAVPDSPLSTGDVARPPAAGAERPPDDLEADAGRDPGSDNVYAKGGRANKINRTVKLMQANRITPEMVAEFKGPQWDIVAKAAGVTRFSKKTIDAIKEAYGLTPVAPVKAGPSPDEQSARHAKAVQDLVDIGVSKEEAERIVGMSPFGIASKPGVVTPSGSEGLPSFGAPKWDQSPQAKAMRAELARRGIQTADAAFKKLVELGTSPTTAKKAAQQMFPTVNDVLDGKGHADYEHDLSTPDGRLAATIARSAKMGRTLGSKALKAKPPPEMGEQLLKDMDAAARNINNAKHMTTTEKKDAQIALAEVMRPDGAKQATRRQLELLEMAFGPQFAATLAQDRALWRKAASSIFELGRFHKSIMTMGDASVAARQAIHYTVSPYYWVKGEVGSDLWKMFRSWGSQKYADAVNASVNEHPRADLHREIGLIRTEADGPLSRREDLAQSRWIERIPVLRQINRMGNRASTAYLNLARQHMFEVNAQVLEKLGYTPQRNPTIYKALAEMANVFTGRGNLGKLETLATELNGAFFSAHMTKARFDAINPFWYAKLKGPVKWMALRDTLSMAAAGATLIGAAKIVAGDKVGVETDLRSPDFGKIRVGNTRFDVFGGHKQPLTLMAQLISGLQHGLGGGLKADRKSIGGNYAVEPWSKPLGKYVRGHLAPTTAWGWDWLSNKTYFGKDVALDRKQAWEHVGNMLIADTLAAVKEHGLSGLLVAPPAFLGIGASTIPDRPEDVFEYRLRSGEDPESIRAEMEQSVRQGEMRKDVAQRVLRSWEIDKSSADFWEIGKLEDAELTFRNGSPEQKQIWKPLLEIKRLNQEEADIRKGVLGRSPDSAEQEEIERIRQQKRWHYEQYDSMTRAYLGEE